jgi:hypothetical protein
MSVFYAMADQDVVFVSACSRRTVIAARAAKAADRRRRVTMGHGEFRETRGGYQPVAGKLVEYLLIDDTALSTSREKISLRRDF